MIHVHDTSNCERADIVGRLGLIFGDPLPSSTSCKFAVKFLNNLLAQVTPFLFYLVGGYLAITGRLDVGGLVAVIAAYKDLPGPIKANCWIGTSSCRTSDQVRAGGRGSSSPMACCRPRRRT